VEKSLVVDVKKEQQKMEHLVAVHVYKLITQL
jgi:hypothetical protein